MVQAGETAPTHVSGTTSEVFDKLRRYIASGGFHDGSRLLPERVLAQELGVGRPALREAIKALGVLDVLESRRGDGTYILSLAALQTGVPPRLSASDKNYHLLELLEVRKMLEPRAAWLAATRADADELSGIMRCRGVIDAALDDWGQVATADYQFHSAIIKAAGNPVLQQIHSMLEPLLLQSLAITCRTAEKRVVADGHKAIAEAIIRREPEQAQSAMLEHLHASGFDLIADWKR